MTVNVKRAGKHLLRVQVSGRMLKYVAQAGRVSQWIAAKLQSSIAKNMLFPSCSDIRLPHLMAADHDAAGLARASFLTALHVRGAHSPGPILTALHVRGAHMQACCTMGSAASDVPDMHLLSSCTVCRPSSAPCHIALRMQLKFTDDVTINALLRRL